MAYYQGDYYQGDYYSGDAPKRRKRRTAAAPKARRAAVAAPRRRGRVTLTKSQFLARMAAGRARAKRLRGRG